jgi:glutamate-1-semialdehyde aminotransferase
MPFLKFTAPDLGVNEAVKTAFYREMLARGVLLHPRHLWFVSYAHSPEDIERTLEHADAAFELCAREVLTGRDASPGAR